MSPRYRPATSRENSATVGRARASVSAAASNDLSGRPTATTTRTTTAQPRFTRVDRTSRRRSTSLRVTAVRDRLYTDSRLGTFKSPARLKERRHRRQRTTLFGPSKHVESNIRFRRFSMATLRSILSSSLQFIATERPGEYRQSRISRDSRKRDWGGEIVRLTFPNPSRPIPPRSLNSVY